MNAVKKIIYNHVIPSIGRLLVGKNRYVNVIYYHDIVKGEGDSFMRTNVDLFKKQMTYIAANGYKTLRFEDLNDPENLKFHSKTVLISFDDGWKSNYEILDFMRSNGLKYNIFLTLQEIGNNPDYLSWEQVKEMYASGVVGFGAHTYTHPSMKEIGKIDPQLEFDKANAVFEEHMGFAPEDFCYPFGYFSAESNEYVATKTSYKRIYTSQYTYSYPLHDRIVFGRCGISNNETFGVFKAKLNGYFNCWKILVH